MRLFHILPICVGLAACSSAPIKVSDPGALTKEALPLTVLSYKPPDFAAQTPEMRALGGLLGAVATIKSGNALVHKESIKDPAEEIVEKLAVEYSAKFKPSRTSRVTLANPSKASVKAVTEQFGAQGVILDVKTTAWGIGPLPYHLDANEVYYTADARLLAEGGVLGKATCKYSSKGQDPAPTRKQLQENGAALLKSSLREAVQVCAKSIQSDML